MQTQQRVAIYARVSTRDKGQDTENQLTQLREHAAKRDWIAQEFIDQASGSHGDRDAFKRLFVAAEQKDFDIVLVWALDRFSRQGIGETFQHIQRLSKTGVRFESLSEPQFSTTGDCGELFLSIAAWIAQQERKRISERTKAGLAVARAKGRVGGRRAVDKPVDRINALRDAGQTITEISRATGLSRSTIQRTLTQRSN
jgi:DNA invertase Pin-like site-specific DNA recombinase